MNGAFRDLARGGCGANRIKSAANGPVSPNADWTDLSDESSKMGGQLLPDAGVRPGAGGRATGQEEPQWHLPPPGRHLLWPHQALCSLRQHAGLSRQRGPWTQTLI